MKKADLKTGMLVEYRIGVVGLVINDVVSLGDNSSYMPLSELNCDLMDSSNSNYDLIKVSTILSGHELGNSDNWTKKTLNENILWKLQEVEYTMEELTEKLGHSFKIKK